MGISSLALNPVYGGLVPLSGAGTRRQDTPARSELAPLSPPSAAPVEHVVQGELIERRRFAPDLAGVVIGMRTFQGQLGDDAPSTASQAAPAANAIAAYRDNAAIPERETLSTVRRIDYFV